MFSSRSFFFLWFQISHLSLQSYLSFYFVYGIESDPVSFFCMKLSSVPVSLIEDTVFYPLYILGSIVYIQFSSVAQSCTTLNPTDCSMPGFPVHHQVLELA